MYRTSSQLVDDVIATIDVKCPTRDGAGGVMRKASGGDAYVVTRLWCLPAPTR